MSSPRKKRHDLDQPAQDYCQTLAEMQDLCEERNLNFRAEMMALAEAWIEAHTPDRDTTPHDHQARTTR